jgi:asparagine synthase (glutamine-hydrolysing)
MGRDVLGRVLKLFPAHRANLLAEAVRKDGLSELMGFARGIGKDFPSPLTADVLARTSPFESILDLSLKEIAGGVAAGEAAARLDMQYNLPDGYMQKLDLSSMAFSLEAREPLLDHELVEWAMRLPWKFKYRGRTGKYLLRKLSYRLLPRHLIDRPKHGFEVPVAHWIRGPLRAWATDLLEDAACYEKLPVSRESVRILFDLHLSGRRNVAPLLWAILMLFCFVREEADRVG